MTLIRKTATCVLAVVAALSLNNVANAKEKLPEKAKSLEYQVSQSSLYNQLSHDLRLHGYTLRWDVRLDPPFTPYIYMSDRDQITDSLNVLNDKADGDFDSGTYIQGLICKQKKQVVVTYSRFTRGVVDADGHSCLLITPVKKDNSQSDFGGYNLNAVAQPTTSTSGANVPGPHIVGQ